MPKHSRLSAFFQQRCPRCHKGSIFKKPDMFAPGFQRMHTHCPECALRYEVEPGFFFASMFISYAFNIALMLGTGLYLILFVENPSIWLLAGLPSVVMLLMLPLTFRYSRVALIYFFSEQAKQSATG